MERNQDILKVTIVTVCRNAENTIRNTIESVLSQAYSNFEYLIIDGLSEDNTYKIVQQYKDKFKKKNITYQYISESDNGIFDAMNKAINMANGEWINFMNADDRFHTEHVLETIFARDINTIDVIYGNTVRIKNHVKTEGKAIPIENIVLTMPFCHQSSFVSTEVMKKWKFNLAYRVADYNFFLRLYLDGGKFLYIDLTVADYSLEGYSNQDPYITYLGVVEIKHDLNLINKKSFTQQLKNQYFKQLMRKEEPFHWLALKLETLLKSKKRSLRYENSKI